MSARSFGFVKPSQIQRETDFVNRLKRHKSFFTPPTQNLGQSELSVFKVNSPSSTPAQKMAAAFRKASNIRKAESFYHSRSLGDFDLLINSDSSKQHGRNNRNNISHKSALYQDFENNFNNKRQDKSRGKSVERLLSGDSTASKSLSKSKSMEFLKSKLLSRKPSSANSRRSRLSPSPTPSGSSSGGLPPGTRIPRSVLDWDHHPHLGVSGKLGFMQNASRWGFDMRSGDETKIGSSSETISKPTRKIKKSAKDEEAYDWRQDTPFWNKQGRWARPSNNKKVVEEPWINPHVNNACVVHQEKIPTGQTIQHHPLNGGNVVPGWPHPPAGIIMGKKMGTGFFPSFPVPYGASSNTNNMFLPRTNLAPSHVKSPSHSNSGSSSGLSSTKKSSNSKVLSSKLTEEDLHSRLEITELSDDEENDELRCPSPDYSTMQIHSTNTVIELNGGGRASSDRNILDLPSGLY